MKASSLIHKWDLYPRLNSWVSWEGAHTLLLGRIMTQPVFRIKDIAKLFQLSVPSLLRCKRGFLCTDLGAKHKFLGLELLRTKASTKMENMSWRPGKRRNGIHLTGSVVGNVSPLLSLHPSNLKIVLLAFCCK